MSYKFYIPDDEECESLKRFKKRFSVKKFATARAWAKKPIDWDKFFYEHHQRVGWRMKWG